MKPIYFPEPFRIKAVETASAKMKYILVSVIMLLSVFVLFACEFGNNRNADPICRNNLPPNRIATGSTHSLKIDAEGRLFSWGWNEMGQLGDGTFITRYSPVHIKQGILFSFVSAATNSSFAIDVDGNLWAWGLNHSGQLGNGDTSFGCNYPMHIMPGTLFSYVRTANCHTLAIDIYGNLFSWGSNNAGQLGDGTDIQRSHPMRIKQGTQFLAVGAGLFYSLAIDIDGNLWTWGRSRGIELSEHGFYVGVNFYTPVHIAQGTSFYSVSVKDGHNLAIDIGGNLWAWGFNREGQVGDGTGLQRYSPVRIEFVN